PPPHSRFHPKFHLQDVALILGGAIVSIDIASPP
ncbi:hypothetical protein A2U01_0112458, partial [Trifolium medium]|nr:hypothetical protein [Trifolium medium]